MALESAPAAPAGERLSGPGSPPLKSAAERLASFDVSAFPVPTGREEEWRFTPRLRMKRLLDDVGEITLEPLEVSGNELVTHLAYRVVHQPALARD